MRISQLEAFIAVYSFRSISKAAVSLRVSQPALTKTVRLMEGELGVTLFNRYPRGVEATIYGHTLAVHAKHVSAEFRTARSQIAAISGGHLGSVRIGAGPYVVADLLPSAVTRVVTKHPKLHVEIVSGSHEHLVGALETGDLDLCVVSKLHDAYFSDVTTIELTQDEFGVIAREGHPLVGDANLRLSDVISYPWVFLGRKFSVASQFAAILRAQKMPYPDSITETDSMAYLVSHLLKSDSLSYQPRHFAEAPYAFGRIMSAQEVVRNQPVRETNGARHVVRPSQAEADGEPGLHQPNYTSLLPEATCSLKIIDVPKTARKFPVVVCHRRTGLLCPGGHALIKELRNLAAGYEN